MNQRRRFFRQGAALVAFGLLAGCVYAPSESDDDTNVVRPGRKRGWWRPRRRRGAY